MRSPPTSRAKSSLKRSFDGTVEYFYDESGSGAIKADSGELITVKRDAITGRQIKTLCPNERVRAVAVLVTQAWRAQQVAVLWPEGGGLQEDQSANLQEAVVTFAHPGHQYYLLANQQHPKI